MLQPMGLFSYEELVYTCNTYYAHLQEIYYHAMLYYKVFETHNAKVVVGASLFLG